MRSTFAYEPCWAITSFGRSLRDRHVLSLGYHQCFQAGAFSKSRFWHLRGIECSSSFLCLLCAVLRSVFDDSRSTSLPPPSFHRSLRMPLSCGMTIEKFIRRYVNKVPRMPVLQQNVRGFIEVSVCLCPTVWLSKSFYFDSTSTRFPVCLVCCGGAF